MAVNKKIKGDKKVQKGKEKATVTFKYPNYASVQLNLADLKQVYASREVFIADRNSRFGKAIKFILALFYKMNKLPKNTKLEKGIWFKIKTLAKNKVMKDISNFMFHKLVKSEKKVKGSYVVAGATYASIVKTVQHKKKEVVSLKQQIPKNSNNRSHVYFEIACKYISKNKLVPSNHPIHKILNDLVKAPGVADDNVGSLLEEIVDGVTPTSIYMIKNLKNPHYCGYADKTKPIHTVGDYMKVGEKASHKGVFGSGKWKIKYTNPETGRVTEIHADKDQNKAPLFINGALYVE